MQQVHVVRDSGLAAYSKYIAIDKCHGQPHHKQLHVNRQIYELAGPNKLLVL